MPYSEYGGAEVTRLDKRRLAGLAHFTLALVEHDREEGVRTFHDFRISIFGRRRSDRKVMVKVS